MLLIKQMIISNIIYILKIQRLLLTDNNKVQL
jgi:hypothetical protein